MNHFYFHTSVARFACIMALVLASTLSFASWTQTGSMHSARASHTATLLPNGYVLAAGGTSNNGALVSSELYNPGSGAWSYTGNMNVGRVSAQAALLGNGSVLVMGGCINNDCLSSTTKSAEIYNPANGTWTLTGSMGKGRAEFVSTLLPNGKVLVAGGCTAYSANGCTSVTAAAEIYNPATGAWSSAGNMLAARMAMTATLLTNGKVLISGGQTAASDALSSAELYDPVAKTFSLTGRMITPRSDHTATLLSNGLVLMAGGENVNGVSTAKAELYNPATGTFAATGTMPATRQEQKAALLPNGYVLVSGGNRITLSGTTVLATCAVYNPGTGTWTTTTSLKNARVDHTSTVLATGRVLDAGGDDGNNELISAELY
jgi:N-acetylneuraminic acid mutarotase